MNFPLWLCQVLCIGEIFCCIMRCKAWARMQMKPCIRMPDNKSPRSWQLLIFPLSALLSSPRSGNPHSTPGLKSGSRKNKIDHTLWSLFNLWSRSEDHPQVSRRQARIEIFLFQWGNGSLHYIKENTIARKHNSIFFMLVHTSDRVGISSAFLGSEQKQPGGENKRCHTTPAGS